MANNRGLVILPSFFAVIDSKNDADRLALYDALARYHFNGEEPQNLTPSLMDLFTLMRPNIDSSRAKYDACVENGKKGGRPAKSAENQSKKPKGKTKAKNQEKEKENDIVVSPLSGEETNNGNTAEF